MGNIMTSVDATTWAADLARHRAEDAVEQYTETYAGSQRLACGGRELLAELVPETLSLRDYLAGTSDYWREVADAAYEAAVTSWLAGGDDDEVRAAAARGSRAAEQHLERYAPAHVARAL